MESEKRETLRMKGREIWIKNVREKEKERRRKRNSRKVKIEKGV